MPYERDDILFEGKQEFIKRLSEVRRESKWDENDEAMIQQYQNVKNRFNEENNEQAKAFFGGELTRLEEQLLIKLKAKFYCSKEVYFNE